ncbi:glycogen/starch/alpha-glucan phosphorylase [Papillibacter cinnamivorans]|uniref:Alpha-1,4 glucan phosphorylase n=1 Tax=Papillibacter cinnamivorans DSM 12816 TaxID=1122930 RepID=A0A1W2A5Y0_9FIRM|nr:glycogen/starch/alpha-glucan phosphorylase [Papillibacter cinnamivorans]SMC55831.1 starch phosphorylase [Papillibacter cinnamivorans DSM 12816]
MASYSKQALADAIYSKLRLNCGRELCEANASHMFRACALVLRDILAERNLDTQNWVRETMSRQVHYMSMEFLLGRSLMKNAFNLGILDALTEALSDMGFHPSDIFETEPDAGLGNGGLGRLAACYMDSMATLGIPATGYSICYELGAFRQKIVNGEQTELPDDWLNLGEAWLIPKPDETEEVRFGGTVDQRWEDGRLRVFHTGYVSVLAVPRDMAVSGYGTRQVNTLRLWDAKAPVSIDMSLFSKGEYLKASEQNAMAAVIAKVLYPADHHPEGKALRLKQQYFFVSATAQSILRRHYNEFGTLRDFHLRHVIQINDTHPALAIPELMRIFMDDYGFGWDEAWRIVSNTVAYTNHTVLPEALEHWSQDLMEPLLPRIWNILCEINNRYGAQVSAFYPGDGDKLRDTAIVWNREVRMANLCVAACFSVNGVSAMHSDILRNQLFRDAAAMAPDKFKNVTNGIDHRRWLAQVNPGMDALVRELTGNDGYLLEPQRLRELERFSSDGAVLERLEKIKAQNKESFARYARREWGFALNTGAIFDVQAKRLHEYKRQLLNAMHILHLYLTLKDNPNMDFHPRVFLFGAKAAPAYQTAKEIIRLISSLSAQIAADPVCKDRLQVFFLPNYRVSLAEALIPASEISEQISAAGKEASGTGNMKFMMNGAVTIGTLDGANVEMHQLLGDENMFLFGLTAKEAEALRAAGYNPREYYDRNPALRRVLEEMAKGFGDGVSYAHLTERLLTGAHCLPDEFFLLPDFEPYRRAQERAGEVYRDRDAWNRMSLLNIARSGGFAADRSIGDYAREIWSVPYRKFPDPNHSR